MSTLNNPEILLPAVGDMSSLADEASDQFTSDEEYWRNLKAFVGDKPSSLNIVYPEIYLGRDDDERISKIVDNMNAYLSKGVFRWMNGLVLVERATQSGVRTGIVLSIDLEDYSYSKDSSSLIRSTEETVASRIPPRVNIRRNAPVELPHIMLLYDDEEGRVLSGVKRAEKLYDFDLNMGGGHVCGTRILNPEEVLNSLYSLADSDVCLKKYGKEDRLLFVVGDGNHSLAAAKAYWEEIKGNLSPEQRVNHPARFALVEAVNLHDPALKFEPIHRLVKTDQPDLFVTRLIRRGLSGANKALVCVNGKVGAMHFSDDAVYGLRELDACIDEFIADYGGSVDYVHGNEQLKALSAEGCGIVVPGIPRDRLFKEIVSGGNLPRKTFSLGDGNEKRYYIEARAIK